jgi:HSP20 family molecular chaperone IbpA
MSLFNSLIQSRARNADPMDNGRFGQAVKPYHEIVDLKDAYALTVYLPGVSKNGLQITAESNEVRIVGQPAWKRPDGWVSLYNESAEVPFELTLEHDHSVDVEKIHAELRDGVLRVSLPKSEALRPRKIAVS